jgi:deoxyhypusine synthase
MKKISSGDVGKSRKNVLGKSEEINGVSVKGYDFNHGTDYEKLIGAFSTTGMQADSFYKAMEIINNMIENKALIYLGYTSSMVTSGLRDIFRYLAEHKMINVIVTTVGGIEEDIIKCFGDFILGDFRAPGKELREKKINRAGNIFIPNIRYCNFEDFVIPILEELYSEQKKTGIPATPSGIVRKLGEKINNEKSIYYWCWKNKIPVFCPAITDGSLGDMIYFFKSSHPDFIVDVAEDIWKINNTNLGEEKTGVIVLGSGIIKHHMCNANLFRNGADYGVYINNSSEYDGSDSGALPEEAVSWGKLAPDSERVKVFGDAILLFPFIVANTFAKQSSKFI